MRNSGWEILWEPTGESPRVLLDFGDLMENEITLPVEGLDFTGRSDFALSAVPVSRGNTKRRLGFTRRLEHESAAASWERCSEEVAGLPWGSRGILSVRPLNGLQRYFHAAISDSSHAPSTGFLKPESVHEYSLRVAPLSAMILPDGTVVTGGYFVTGGYHVPQLPPGVSIPPDTKVIITGTPGVIPGNYTVGGDGVPSGGGGIDVPVEEDDEPASVPTITSAPAISGDPTPGGELTCTPGAWSNAVSVTRRWFHNGTQSGATGLGFTIPESAEEGDTISLLETAINGAKVTLAWSNTITVVEVVPQNVTPPVISGLNTVGSLLTVTPGTWEGAGSIARQWLRNGELTGVTGLTFTIPEEAEDGDDILCRETAANGFGSAVADSNVIEVAAVPTNTVPPSISGDPEAGGLLTATAGTWTAAESVTGEWFFNGAATGDTDLTWAFPGLAEDGDYAFYKETATNDTGSAEAFSNIITIGAAFDTSPVSLPAADLWVAFQGGQWVGRRFMTFVVEFQGLPAGTTLQVNGNAPVAATGSGSTDAETQFRFTVSAFPLDADPADTENRFRPFLADQDYTADEAAVFATWDDGFAGGEFAREDVLSFSLTLRNSTNDVIASFTVVPKVSTTCRMRSLADAVVEQDSGRAVRLIDGEGGIELLTPEGFVVL